MFCSIIYLYKHNMKTNKSMCQSGNHPIRALGFNCLCGGVVRVADLYTTWTYHWRSVEFELKVMATSKLQICFCVKESIHPWSTMVKEPRLQKKPCFFFKRSNAKAISIPIYKIYSKTNLFSADLKCRDANRLHTGNLETILLLVGC